MGLNEIDIILPGWGERFIIRGSGHDEMDWRASLAWQDYPERGYAG